jgi:hypothetical protein
VYGKRYLSNFATFEAVKVSLLSSVRHSSSNILTKQELYSTLALIPFILVSLENPSFT